MNYAKLERLALKATRNRRHWSMAKIGGLLSDMADVADDTSKSDGWRMWPTSIFGVASFVALVVTIGATVWGFCTGYWDVANAALLLCVSSGGLSLLSLYVPALVCALRIQLRSAPVLDLTPSAVIPRYLATRIDELEDEVIGDASPYAQTREHDALRALADLDRRIETFDPGRLMTSA